MQERVLVLLATITPRWTLTGGGALAGFHTLHRETRDLDLFFRGQRTLTDLVRDVRERLESEGLEVTTLRTTSTFSQLQVVAERSSVVIDLVADPTPLAEEPGSAVLGTVSILVDTPHQLLVNKLCALLSHSELRDLVDVRELLARGGDLRRALADCPHQDGGFSPLTFGWAMRGLPVQLLATSLGLQEPAISELVRFRDELIERVVQGSRPDE